MCSPRWGVPEPELLALPDGPEPLLPGMVVRVREDLPQCPGCGARCWLLTDESRVCAYCGGMA